MRPDKGTYPEYYDLYIPLVKENVVAALNSNWEELRGYIPHIAAAKEEYSYGPGKWTVKQVVQHMIDTERVISYRALRFGRKDPQANPPFEEDAYAANAELAHRNLKDLMEEYEAVRKATICLFRSFSENTLLLKGKTFIGETTVVALGFLISGHALHHLNVLKTRYQ
jgi:hypothetical protein